MNDWLEQKIVSYETFKRQMANFRSNAGHIKARQILKETEVMLDALYAKDMREVSRARLRRDLLSKYIMADGIYRTLKCSATVEWVGDFLVATGKRGGVTRYWVNDKNRLQKVAKDKL